MNEELKKDLEAFFKRFPQEKSAIYTEDGSIYFAKNMKDASGHAERNQQKLQCCNDKLEPCEMPAPEESVAELQANAKTHKTNSKKR